MIPTEIIKPAVDLPGGFKKPTDLDRLEFAVNRDIEVLSKERVLLRLEGRGNSIVTYTGKMFYPFDPKPEDVDIVDIAHALSNVCRFTGHTSEFYSVAQHAVLVSRYCSQKNALWGLLHDAAEAYICDMSQPVKQMPCMEVYRIVEKKIMNAVIDRFQLWPDQPDEVTEIDGRLLQTEARDLGLLSPAWKYQILAPYETRIQPLDPKQAKALFMQRFVEVA